MSFRPNPTADLSRSACRQVLSSGEYVLHGCCGVVAHAGHNVIVGVERYRDSGVPE